jgi:hypothetical protein
MTIPTTPRACAEAIDDDYNAAGIAELQMRSLVDIIERHIAARDEALIMEHDAAVVSAFNRGRDQALKEGRAEGSAPIAALEERIFELECEVMYVAEAWRRGVEAAAQVVDQCNREGPYNAIGAAARIRALATKSPPDAALAREQHRHEQTVDERDAAEEALSQAYYLVIGKSPEWSNLFGHEQALEAIRVAVTVLKKAARAAAAEEPTP